MRERTYLVKIVICDVLVVSQVDSCIVTIKHIAELHDLN